MPPPAQLATVYATDESIAIRAPGDFMTLCPDWQVLARGTDGVFASGTPWTLSSASQNFQTYGVAANMVVSLTSPKTAFRGSGELLAVESVSGTSVTLRRLGENANVGYPPGTGGLASVAFSIATLYPQIEEASFDLNRRFGIDPAKPGRTPSDAYDLRDLRQATILTVLRNRYMSESRGKDGDFPRKYQVLTQELSDVIARLTIRWISSATNEASYDQRISMRIVR